MSQAPTFVLPVIVLTYVTANQYAQFFLAWSAASTVFLIPVSIAGVLLVESAKHTAHEARARYLETLGMSLGLMFLAAVAAIAGQGIVVRLYGPHYHEAARLIPQMIIASFPWAFTSVAIARARARKDNQTVVATTVVLGLVIIVGALVLVPTEGVHGAIVAWGLGQLMAAIVAALVGLRTNRGPTGGFAADDPRVSEVIDDIVLGDGYP